MEKLLVEGIMTMDDDKTTPFDPRDQGEYPARLRQENVTTETLDLNELFPKEETDSGSFDLGTGIWSSTFGKVIQALPIMVLLIDRSHKLVIANSAWRKMSSGYERILGNPFGALFSKGPVAAEAEAIVEKVFATRRTETWEALIRLDNSKIWGRMTLRPMRIAQERFLLALIEDLTSEKKQRIQDKKFRAELEKRVERRTKELTRLNERLLAAERRYRRLYEKAPLMCVITRNEHGMPFVEDCNDLFLDATGYSRQEVLGRPLGDFYSPESQHDLIEDGGYAKALEGRFCIGERQLITRTGEIVPTLLYSAIEEDPEGRVIGTRAMFVNIAERKRAEEALAESEARFRGVFENHHAVMLILDPETGAIEDASPGACAFYGYTRPELKAKKILDINTLSPEQIFHRLQLAKSSRQRHFEFQHRLASGEIRDVEVCSGPITVGGRSLLLSIIHDVTDRRYAEEALLKSESKYRALFDESKDGVYSVLRTGEMTDANPSALEMFGFKREEIIGKDIRELYANADDRINFQEEIEKQGFVKDYELTLQRKDGSTIPCLITSSVQLDDKGTVVGYRGIIRDLTIRKRLQKELFQAQKMEAIGTLAGGIAHDFNNLLTVVLGFSELLLIGKDERDPSFADLQKINRAARSGADLVQRILAFSRKTDIKPRPLNLNEEIEHTRKLLTRTIPKMIEIDLRLSEGLGTVNADPIQVEQIIMNLAVNAKDAMPDGGRLTIDTANVTLDGEYCKMHMGAKPGDYVRLSVSDTGHGMDRKTIQHIFEPFYTTKEVGRGTGLGLAMVYGIVKQHDGYITCESQPGQGSIFNIYFPVIKISEEPGPATTALGQSGGSETILLVDDEELIMDLGKTILSRAGYRVITARNGREALSVFIEKKDEIDLVILDMIMPQVSGKEVLEKLLRIDAKARVVVATGLLPEEATRQWIKANAKGFIKKPFQVKEMLGIIRDALDR